MDKELDQNECDDEDGDEPLKVSLSSNTTVFVPGKHTHLGALTTHPDGGYFFATIEEIFFCGRDLPCRSLHRWEPPYPDIRQLLYHKEYLVVCTKRSGIIIMRLEQTDNTYPLSLRLSPDCPKNLNFMG